MARRQHPSPPPGSDDPVPDEAGTRTILRRTPLPNGRAVAGGFLVAVAALAATGANLQAARPPAQRHVVASRPIAPGATLTAADLTLAAADLPTAQPQRLFDQVSDLEGAIAAGPVGAGELVQQADVILEAAGGGRPAPQPEVALTLDRAAAVDGALVPGERVDLLATYGTGDTAYTLTVARDALVRVSEQHDGDGLSSAGGAVTLTLAVADREEVIAAVHAAQSGSITVVRTTGLPPDGAGQATGAYRPDRPPTP